jgi:hypothetical protein
MGFPPMIIVASVVGGLLFGTLILMRFQSMSFGRIDLKTALPG